MSTSNRHKNLHAHIIHNNQNQIFQWLLTNEMTKCVVFRKYWLDIKNFRQIKISQGWKLMFNSTTFTWNLPNNRLMETNSRLLDVWGRRGKRGGNDNTLKMLEMFCFREVMVTLCCEYIEIAQLHLSSGNVKYFLKVLDISLFSKKKIHNSKIPRIFRNSYHEWIKVIFILYFLKGEQL